MRFKIEGKAWDPNLESEVRKIWDEEGLYRFQLQDSNYTIDTPPPYPSGRPWHIGAAAHYAQIDMIARTARMSGKNVYFPIGIDRNGLPVEMYTEKMHGIRMREMERGRFLDLCAKALDDLEEEMVQIMKSLGISGLIDERYRTDSAEYRALTQSTFIELWRKGRIYLATRPNNYDWVSGTTIADAEVRYENLRTKLVYMRFGGGVVVASTRPELLCACRAIIVNPDDERYASIVGSRVQVPIYGNKVEVVAHSSARPEFGSGAVMICSYGDQNDVAMFRELNLEEVASIGPDGRMTDAAGTYAGLRPKQARTKIIEDLDASGCVERIEEITHRTPVSERSGVPIETVPMEEYYLKQVDSVERLRQLAEEIRFHPPMHRQILFNWLEYVSIDWPISRRRYYGTEIPVWYCSRCNEPNLPEPGRYYRPWRDLPPMKACSKCGCRNLVGEERTFDTWMDSSASPLFISRYGIDDRFYKKTYPAAVRPQAKDIVRTWLYYTLLKCDTLTCQKPWSEAWIMGYGLDERGMKMSKSRGNAMDPLPIIERLGADTFRFWSASEVNHGYDFRCNEQKIEASKKFLSKLWNVARLLSTFPAIESASTTATDCWVLAELDKTVRECEVGYRGYNFFVPATAVREFTWNIFAAHYIEMVKERARGDGFSSVARDAARFTLHKVFSTVLKLLAPITPFITEYLWRALYSDSSIHTEPLVRPQNLADLSHVTREIVEFNSTVWNMKKSRNLSLKDSVDANVPEELSAYAPDLVRMHRIARGVC